jgi:F-type H+-transporting ATPase subunit epsilon
MTESFPLDIITPERVFLSCTADMVVVPATDGQMGLMIGHCPIVSSLSDGVVEVYTGNQVTDRISITGGFVEMDGSSRCVILAEQAIQARSA